MTIRDKIVSNLSIYFASYVNNGVIAGNLLNMRIGNQFRWRIFILLGMASVIAFAEAAPTVDAMHVSPRWGQPLNGRLIIREASDGLSFKVRMATAEEYRARGLYKADFLDSVSVYSDPDRPRMPLISGTEPVSARQFDVLIATQDMAGNALTNFSVKAIADGHFEVTRHFVYAGAAEPAREKLFGSDSLSTDGTVLAKKPTQFQAPRAQRRADSVQPAIERVPGEVVRPAGDEFRPPASARADHADSSRFTSGDPEKVVLLSSSPIPPLQDSSVVNGRSRSQNPEPSGQEEAFTISKMNLVLYLLVTLILLFTGYVLRGMRRAVGASQSPKAGGDEAEGRSREPRISPATAGNSWEAPGGTASGADRHGMNFGFVQQSVDPEMALAYAAAQQSYAATAARLKQQHYQRIVEEAGKLKLGGDTPLRGVTGSGAESPSHPAKEVRRHEAPGSVQSSWTGDQGRRDTQRETPAAGNPEDSRGLSAQAPSGQAAIRRSVPSTRPVEAINRGVNPQGSGSMQNFVPGAAGPSAPDSAAAHLSRRIQSRPGSAETPVNPEAHPNRPNVGTVAAPQVMTAATRSAVNPVAGNEDGPERQKIELAAVYMSMGDFPTARILLREVMSSPNTMLHGKANELLNEINGLEK